MIKKKKSLKSEISLPISKKTKIKNIRIKKNKLTFPLNKKPQISTRFKLLKKLKTPSRLDIKPYYKKLKDFNKKKKPLQRSNEIKQLKKSFFVGNLKLNKTSFTNIHKSNLFNPSLTKSNLLNPSLTKSNHQSDQSNLEIKKFKLSDFGLSINIKKSNPLQFGCNNYLAPEVCQMGPDSSKVKDFNSINK